MRSQGSEDEPPPADDTRSSATGHRNLFQLAIGKKSNPLTVGREERVPCIHGAGKRHGAQLAQAAEIELGPLAALCREGEE